MEKLKRYKKYWGGYEFFLDPERYIAERILLKDDAKKHFILEIWNDEKNAKKRDRKTEERRNGERITYTWFKTIKKATCKWEFKVSKKIKTAKNLNVKGGKARMPYDTKYHLKL